MLIRLGRWRNEREGFELNSWHEAEVWPKARVIEVVGFGKVCEISIQIRLAVPRAHAEGSHKGSAHI